MISIGKKCGYGKKKGFIKSDLHKIIFYQHLKEFINFGHEFTILEKAKKRTLLATYLKREFESGSDPFFEIKSDGIMNTHKLIDEHIA